MTQMPEALAVTGVPLAVPSMNACTEAPGSAVPWMWGRGLLVALSPGAPLWSAGSRPVMTGAAGAMVSIVTDRGPDVPTLPATSVAWAVMVWRPSVRPGVATWMVQLPEAMAVTGV